MARPGAFFVIPVIAALVLALYAAGYVLGLLLGWPAELSLPRPLRVLGLMPIAYGFVMFAWVVRFRGPRSMLESTWATFLKLARLRPLQEPAGRTEPLVVEGPYRLVRHPLYSAIDGFAFGIAVLADHPWAYLGAVALGLWFAFILAPFEERELRALFGSAYGDYARSIRRFLPLPRRSRP